LGIGLALAVLLTLVVRPLVVGVLLLPIRPGWGERLFVLWAGPKSADPARHLPAHRGSARRDPVVRDHRRGDAFSVVLQASLVLTVAIRPGVPIRAIEPEP
jgi:cell volume regulation protein A